MTTLRSIILLFSLILIPVLACAPQTPTPEPEFRVEQTSADFDDPVPATEPVIISNCGGASLPGQEIRRRSTVKIEGEASLGVGYGILEGKLLAHYGAEQQSEVVQELPTIQNMKMIYHITWYEDVFTGFITTDRATDKANYWIRIPTHADVNITYIDCIYENFIRSIEPPIRDDRVLKAIQMALENEDLPGAKRRMLEAGYPDGIPVTFLLSRFEQMGSSTESAEIQILVEKLAAIGVWVQPIPKD